MLLGERLVGVPECRNTGFHQTAGRRFTMSNEPDFLICTECETPCYTFDWDQANDTLMDAACIVCGNDKKELFVTEEEFMGEE
jgi:hypothetical protein